MFWEKPNDIRAKLPQRVAETERYRVIPGRTASAVTAKDRLAIREGRAYHFRCVLNFPAFRFAIDVCHRREPLVQGITPTLTRHANQFYHT